MQQAQYFEEADHANKTVRCVLCPHKCVIPPDSVGACRVRKNRQGRLFSLVYNEAVSVNVDPIEKKPLYHFYPGSSILSLGTLGCSFRCSFCQNWEISQAEYGQISSRDIDPKLALKLAKQYNSIGIAYTYNEPLVNYEWVKETAALFKANGLKNILVTNGYINPKPWEELLEYIDAANIDVKSFNEDFYRKYCGAKLKPVLESVEMMVKKGVHVELTNLIIPNCNDSMDEIESLVAWIGGLDREIPLHFSRYYPQYRLKEPATGMETLVKAYDTAKKKLDYVYVGNVQDDKLNSTFCPGCGNLLIKRAGFSIEITGLKDGCCSKCRKKIKIKFREGKDA